jgi:FAD/FMN-containing dehydrogenase
MGIAKCLDANEVAVAVKVCRKHRTAATVRGGGHNVAGHSVADGCLLIDVCDESVIVSQSAERVSVGGGALWQHVDEKTAPSHVPAGLIR